MGETKIEWCDFTFNPWVGCSKVSPACKNCYAEGWAKRSGLVQWGDGAERRRTSESNWRQPLKWNKEAKKAGERRRVFCASLADVFEDHSTIMPGWRADLGRLILDTPNLDWLLLTKRPENIARMAPDFWINLSAPYQIPQNVRLGATAENQEMYDSRIDELFKNTASGYFLSIEPLLGPIDLRLTVKFLGGGEAVKDRAKKLWVIVGGESGPNARAMHPDWARSLRDQCKAATVPYFFKQWGEWASGSFPPKRMGGLTSRPQYHQSTYIDLTGKPRSTNELDSFNKPTDWAFMTRIGKKTAGRLLDGVEWNQFPEQVNVERTNLATTL